MSLAEAAAEKNAKFLQGEHILIRMTYISRYNTHNDNDELNKILDQARKNNSSRGITGVLVFNHDYFLQSIEGRRPLINELLRKLVKDPRHFSLQIIETREIDQRRWTHWDMNYLTPTARHKDKALQFSGASQFNPYLMSKRQIMMLIETLTKMQEQEAKNSAVKKRGLFGLLKAS
ncbi:MAG: BLUF domain-containing protein [Pseudomonadota bacterium]